MKRKYTQKRLPLPPDKKKVMAIPKKLREKLEAMLLREESVSGRSYVASEILEMLRKDELSKEDKEHLMRYYNFKKRFLETGRGEAHPDDHHDDRLLVDLPGDTYRDIVPVLAECLTFAGEDLEDFLWVLDDVVPWKFKEAAK